MLTPFIHHTLTECEGERSALVLRWPCCCCLGLDIKQSGDPNIWDQGWRTSFRVESRRLQQKLCAHTDHSPVCFCGQKTKALCCTSAHTAKSLRTVQTQLPKRTLWRISVFVLGCLWLCLLVSLFFLPPPSSLPLMSHLSSTCTFSVPPFYPSISRFCYLYRKSLNCCWMTNCLIECVHIAL